MAAKVLEIDFLIYSLVICENFLGRQVS